MNTNKEAAPKHGAASFCIPESPTGILKPETIIAFFTASPLMA